MEAGWYTDPWDAAAQRYWDGGQWTGHTSGPSPAPTVAAPAAAPVVAPAAVVPVATEVPTDSFEGALDVLGSPNSPAVIEPTSTPPAGAYQQPAQPYAPPAGAAPGYGGTPGYGAGPQAAPQYGGPQYGNPQYGGPQYGGPQGAPQYGAPQYGGPGPHYGHPVVAPKNPAVSLIVSFFIPGVGSMINGDVGLGIVILICYFIAWFFSFFLIGIPFVIGFWVFGMVNAYQGAQKWNAAHGILS
jgi:TM2 domain-containing membrane protein YozV